MQPDEPAYPIQTTETGRYGETYYNAHHGLTKREAFAMAAMQGMLSNPELMNHVNGYPSTESVVGYVDELLKQLDKP